MRAKVTAVEEVPTGVQVVVALRFEREGHDKPICVAESIGRFVERPT
jgi:hypothetical protein